MAYDLIKGLIGSERENSIVRLSHGYEVELPIQCVPEVVKLISSQNMAIYQVVRYAKTSNSWV
jgi:hypothetical protein